ncbi:MAG: hypothetical protein ACOCRO_03095 [Halanaerobiales bacterium]
MIKLGKGKTGEVAYITEEEFLDAVKNPSPYLKSLNNQQKAKLRKKINRYKRENGLM